MVMHSKLIVEKNSLWQNTQICIPLFKNMKDINFNNPNHILRIAEYTPFSIIFNRENNEKLYFDIFDIVYGIDFETDANGDLFTTKNKIKIVDTDESINSVIVPGYYHLKIVGEEIFHGIIEIIPKDLSEPQWKTMFEELQKESRLLVMSLNNKTNSSLVNAKIENDDLISKMNYLQANYNKLSDSLLQIKDNPRSTLEKEYKWLDKNISPPIDKNSLKMHMKKPNKRDYIYTANRKLNYDNKENRWLKSSINKIKNSLILMEKEIKYKKFDLEKLLNLTNFNNEKSSILSNLNELDSINILINKLLTRILLVEKQEWYTTVSHVNNPIITSAILLDSKYRSISKWIDSFFKKQNILIFSENLQYSWKRTDELYEIWCFIKVLNILLKLNYTPVSGWIYDGTRDTELKDGTRLKLINKDISISLYFNEVVKNNSTETSIDNPVFTTFKNNKPDIRLDIYIEGEFVKTLPIEVKYRRLNSIIRGKNNSISQLKSYSYNLRSKHHYMSFDSIFREHQSIVNELLVLFPQTRFNRPAQGLNTLIKDDKIEFLPVKPGQSLDILENKIKEVISKINDYYLYQKRKY